jgi:hypothetical protein
VGEGAVVGALRMGYVCLQVKDHPVIQTLLQLRNAAGAPLARTHAHTHTCARAHADHRQRLRDTPLVPRPGAKYGCRR